MKTQLQILAATLLALGATGAYVYHLGGEAATLTQRLHASDSTIKVLEARKKVVDTLYRRDTVRLRIATTRWDTVKMGVDTITVPVPVEVVKTIVATADTALRACSVVVQTCEQRVAQRDSIILVLKSQRPLLLDQKDGWAKRTAKKAGWVLLGAGIGYIGGSQAGVLNPSL